MPLQHWPLSSHMFPFENKEVLSGYEFSRRPLSTTSPLSFSLNHVNSSGKPSLFSVIKTLLLFLLTRSDAILTRPISQRASSFVNNSNPSSMDKFDLLKNQNLVYFLHQYYVGNLDLLSQ